MSNPFEDHAREEFSRHEVPVDVEALWAEVYPKVKEEKKDRKIFWFFLTGFLLASVIFATFYLLQKENNMSTSQAGNTLTENSQTQPDVFSQKDNNLVTEPNNASATPLKDEDEPRRDAGGIEVEPASLKERVEIAVAVEKTTSPAPNKNKQTKSSTNGAIEQFKQTGESSINKPPANSGIVGAGTTAQNKSLQSNTGIAKTDDATNTNHNNSPPSPTPGLPEKTMTTPPLQEITKQEETPLQIENTQAEPTDHIEPEAPITIPTVGEKPDEPLQKDDPEKTKDEVLIKKLTRGLRYGIGMYGGISRSAVSLTTNKPDTNEYLTLRKQNEEELETVHLGLNFLLQSKRNIYLRTGLEYSRMARLFSSSSEKVTEDTIDGVVELRINGITGDTTKLYGEVITTTIETYRKKSYNYIHLLDAPIIFGYNFGDEQWRIGVEAGVFANVLLKRKGEIFDAEENYYDTATDEEQWYKTNIGITPYIGINAAYNLAENIQLHLTPGFRFRKVFTSDKSLLKEERANLGMWAGIRYLF